MAGQQSASAEDMPAADPVAVARTIALRYLEQSPRSRRQVAQRLASRAVPASAVEPVLDWLTDYGYLDDLAFAQVLVRSRTSTKYLSRRALRHELALKGVARDIILQVLADVSDDDEAVMARELVRRRSASMSMLQPDVRHRRLAGMLARKGYGSSTIRAALADLD